MCWAKKVRRIKYSLKGNNLIDVSIITVSYNCREYLQMCLDAVKKAMANSHLNVEMIVVDNDSTDGTKAIKNDKKYEWIKWIDAENKGFAAGNNRGMELAKGKYLFLINPDTEIGPDNLFKLKEFIESKENVGMVGPRLVYGDGSLQISALDSEPTLLTAFLENTLLDRVFYKLFPDRIYPGKYFSIKLHDRIREVDHVLGAAMFLPREVFDKVGRLDEDCFFFSREESDWQKRIKLAGWRVLYWPEVTVIHHEGKASGEARFSQNWPKKLDLDLPSAFRYERKWRGGFSAWILMMIYFLGSIWTISILLWFYLAVSIFGWLMPKKRERWLHSIVYIMYYHWNIIKWLVGRWVKGKSVYEDVLGRK